MVSRTTTRKNIERKSHKTTTIYLSGYNAGDPNQNDSSPCIAASGRNICHMLANDEYPIALVPHIRHELDVNYGDKVHVQCRDGREFIASVEDNMNKRFRDNCITSSTSQGYCIKGDIAFPYGVPVSGCVAQVLSFK